MKDDDEWTGPGSIASAFDGLAPIGVRAPGVFGQFRKTMEHWRTGLDMKEVVDTDSANIGPSSTRAADLWDACSLAMSAAAAQADTRLTNQRYVVAAGLGVRGTSPSVLSAGATSSPQTTCNTSVAHVGGSFGIRRNHIG